MDNAVWRKNCRRLAQARSRSKPTLAGNFSASAQMCGKHLSSALGFIGLFQALLGEGRKATAGAKADGKCPAHARRQGVFFFLVRHEAVLFAERGPATASQATFSSISRTAMAYVGSIGMKKSSAHLLEKFCAVSMPCGQGCIFSPSPLFLFFCFSTNVTSGAKWRGRGVKMGGFRVAVVCRGPL